MSSKPSDQNESAISTIDASESVNDIREMLKAAQNRLAEMGDDAQPVLRARALLDVAEPMLGLGQKPAAWQHAREAFSVFIDYEHWQDAVEAVDLLYQTEEAGSISALGQGIWLGITYPVKAATTVKLLDYVIDETPDDSDGAAVAAMMAHYIADIRTKDEDRDSLKFLTTQLIARVAKRHRGIEDQKTLDVWIEMLQLNNIPELLKKMAQIIDVMVEDRWWFDRDELRAKLPVN